MPPKTLAEVINLLGMSATYSLVMLHSTQSLVEIKDDVSRKLFAFTWQRLVVKTSIASFLSDKLNHKPMEDVQMALLLSEVGSLAVLSTLLECQDKPNTGLYFLMCREYSKKLGCEILTKWEVDESIIKMLSDSGQWHRSWESETNDLDLLDLANLAIYNTVLFTSKDPSLPKLESIAAFGRIPDNMKTMSKPNWLKIVTDNREEIQAIVHSFK